jgi:hypothetical protein
MAGEAPRESLAYVALPAVGHDGLQRAPSLRLERVQLALG